MTMAVRTGCLAMLFSFVDEKLRIRDQIRLPFCVCLGFGRHTRFAGELREHRWYYSCEKNVV